jgi:hypothetical protein
MPSQLYLPIPGFGQSLLEIRGARGWLGDRSDPLQKSKVIRSIELEHWDQTRTLTANRTVTENQFRSRLALVAQVDRAAVS